MKTNSITFRVSDSEKEKLMAMAMKRDIPVSQLIREAAKRLLEEGTDASSESIPGKSE